MTLIKLKSGTEQDKPKKIRKISLNKRQSVFLSQVFRQTNSSKSYNKTHQEPIAREGKNNNNVILIVDDTPSNLQVLFTCLENAGYRVLVTQNGENALKIAHSQLPDLILLDILMPGLDGFQTCQLLKQQNSTRDIPIIFLTALSETFNKVRGFDVGGVDYVTKPIDREELLARIQTHLKLQQMQQRLAERNEELQQEIQIRQQIEEQLQQALDFRALVGSLSEKIRDSLDEGQILQTVTEALTQTLQLEGCQIEFYDSVQNVWTIAYEYTTDLPSSEGVTRSFFHFPELDRQLWSKQPLQFVERTPEFSPANIQLTRLVCPILEPQPAEKIIGNLWLLRRKEEAFNDLEVRLVEEVASQCAIAIRQARLYEASQIQVRELEKLNQLKDDFLRTISHELRTPMSSIKLAAQTLEKLISVEQTGDRSSTFNKVMRIFQQACNRQNELVDDLLSLCYLDAKAETLVFEVVELHSWLPEIVSPFVERAQSQQQELIIDLPESIPALCTDLITLERILTELLNNACKYTPASGTILVSVRATEKIIELQVTNYGIEISPQEFELIFERFYRIPDRDPWQYGGTGLGLTLVKKMVELLQASIGVDSKDNRTTFSVKFYL
jgi:signal transduction histidine kinase/CheY-like chemotaxis protein